MADCECLATCPFFNDRMENMPTTAEVIKKRYCKSNNLNCARYQVFKAVGKEHVPGNLLPNRIDLVDEIIAKTKKSSK